MISAVEARTVDTTTEVAVIPRPVCTGLLRNAQDFHAAGLKAFGLLLGDPADPLFPFPAVDVVVFDPRRNRRNDPVY